MRGVRTLVVGVVVVGVASLPAVPLAHAVFRQDATAASALTAAQLTAPTSLAVTRRCTLGALGVVLAASLDLTWAPSATAWASGQRVVVTDTAGLTVASRSLSPSASSASVGLPLVSGGSYTATVRATYGSWSSAPSTAVSVGC